MESEFQLLNSWYLQLIQLPRSTGKRTPLKLRRETSESTIQQQQQFVLVLLTLGLNLSTDTLNRESTVTTINNTSSDSDSNSSHEILFSTFPIIYQFGRTRIHLTKCQFQHLTKLKEFMLNMKAKVIQRFFKKSLKRILVAKRIQHWWRGQLINRQLAALEHYSTIIPLPSPQDNNNHNKDDDEEEESDNDSLFFINSSDNNIQSLSIFQSNQGTTSEDDIQEVETNNPTALSSTCLQFIIELIDLPTHRKHIISHRYLPPQSRSNSEKIFYSQYNNTTTTANMSSSSSNCRNFKKQSNFLNYLLPFCYKSQIFKFYETIESVKGLLDIVNMTDNNKNFF